MTKIPFQNFNGGTYNILWNSGVNFNIPND